MSHLPGSSDAPTIIVLRHGGKSQANVLRQSTNWDKTWGACLGGFCGYRLQIAAKDTAVITEYNVRLVAQVNKPAGCASVGQRIDHNCT